MAGTQKWKDEHIRWVLERRREGKGFDAIAEEWRKEWPKVPPKDGSSIKYCCNTYNKYPEYSAYSKPPRLQRNGKEAREHKEPTPMLRPMPYTATIPLTRSPYLTPFFNGYNPGRQVVRSPSLYGVLDSPPHMNVLPSGVRDPSHVLALAQHANEQAIQWRSQSNPTYTTSIEEGPSSTTQERVNMKSELAVPLLMETTTIVGDSIVGSPPRALGLSPPPSVQNDAFRLHDSFSHNYQQLQNPRQPRQPRQPLQLLQPPRQLQSPQELQPFIVATPTMDSSNGSGSGPEFFQQYKDEVARRHALRKMQEANGTTRPRQRTMQQGQEERFLRQPSAPYDGQSVSSIASTPRAQATQIPLSFNPYTQTTVETNATVAEHSRQSAVLVIENCHFGHLPTTREDYMSLVDAYMNDLPQSKMFMDNIQRWRDECRQNGVYINIVLNSENAGQNMQMAASGSRKRAMEDQGVEQRGPKRPKTTPGPAQYAMMCVTNQGGIGPSQPTRQIQNMGNPSYPGPHMQPPAYNGQPNQQVYAPTPFNHANLPTAGQTTNFISMPQIHHMHPQPNLHPQTSQVQREFYPPPTQPNLHPQIGQDQRGRYPPPTGPIPACPTTNKTHMEGQQPLQTYPLQHGQPNRQQLPRIPMQVMDVALRDYMMQKGDQGWDDPHKRETILRNPAAGPLKDHLARIVLGANIVTPSASRVETQLPITPRVNTQQGMGVHNPGQFMPQGQHLQNPYQTPRNPAGVPGLNGYQFVTPPDSRAQNIARNSQGQAFTQSTPTPTMSMPAMGLQALPPVPVTGMMTPGSAVQEPGLNVGVRSQPPPKMSPFPPAVQHPQALHTQPNLNSREPGKEPEVFTQPSPRFSPAAQYPQAPNSQPISADQEPEKELDVFTEPSLSSQSQAGTASSHTSTGTLSHSPEPPTPAAVLVRESPAQNSPQAKPAETATLEISQSNISPQPPTVPSLTDTTPSPLSSSSCPPKSPSDDGWRLPAGWSFPDQSCSPSPVSKDSAKQSADNKAWVLAQERECEDPPSVQNKLMCLSSDFPPLEGLFGPVIELMEG